MNVLLLAAVAALVAVNGFFVGAEFALVRARRSRLEALERKGARGAGLALRQLDGIDSYLAACQLGITMASLGIGFLGEPAIASLLEPTLGEFFSHAVAVAIAIALAYVIVTFAHITVGEQVPKIWSIVHAETAARLVSRPLQLFYVVSHPLTWLLNSVSNAMLRLIGTNARAEFSESGEDVRLLIAESVMGGRLDAGEAAMLSGVMQLPVARARQVMTPFHAVVKVESRETVRTALERCLESGHTRIVVVDDDRPDHAIGVAHANSLTRIVLDGGAAEPVASATKPALVVPETKPLNDLLADLQRDRTLLAIVADEYGVPAGIVTVEDIVEEIVGEIADETDPLASPVRQLPNGDWYAHGDVPLQDLTDFGIELPSSRATRRSEALCSTSWDAWRWSATSRTRTGTRSESSRYVGRGSRPFGSETTNRRGETARPLRLHRARTCEPTTAPRRIMDSAVGAMRRMPSSRRASRSPSRSRSSCSTAAAA